MVVGVRSTRSEATARIASAGFTKLRANRIPHSCCLTVGIVDEGATSFGHPVTGEVEAVPEATSKTAPVALAASRSPAVWSSPQPLGGHVECSLHSSLGVFANGVWGQEAPKQSAAILVTAITGVEVRERERDRV
jgi:hypothetical protein